MCVYVTVILHLEIMAVSDRKVNFQQREAEILDVMSWRRQLSTFRGLCSDHVRGDLNLEIKVISDLMMAFVNVRRLGRKSGNRGGFRWRSFLLLTCTHIYAGAYLLLPSMCVGSMYRFFAMGYM